MRTFLWTVCCSLLANTASACEFPINICVTVPGLYVNDNCNAPLLGLGLGFCKEGFCADSALNCYKDA